MFPSELCLGSNKLTHMNKVKVGYDGYDSYIYTLSMWEYLFNIVLGQDFVQLYIYYYVYFPLVSYINH